MGTPEEHPDLLPLENRPPAIMEWLIGCLLVAVILSLVTTYVPAPLKKIGLYFVLCGGLMGWLTAFIGRECSIVSRKALRTAGFVFALASLLNLSWLSSRALLKESEAALEKSPEAKLARTFSEQPNGDPQTRESFRRRYQPGFVDYLQVRVSPLGDWSAPWPVVFWGMELLAGSLCGAWMAARSSGRT